MKRQGGAITWAPNHSGGADILRGRQTNPNNVTRTFFNIQGVSQLLKQSGSF